MLANSVERKSQWRPQCIVHVLRRVRQCAPADPRACLLDELDGMDRATALTIMAQLTDAELEALMEPGAARLMDTLPQSELEALASGDRAAQRRIRPFLKEWRA